MRLAGKIAAWIYGIGYVLFVVVAGVSTWSEMTFMQWWDYMAWQVGLYAPLWPIIVPVQFLAR